MNAALRTLLTCDGLGKNAKLAALDSLLPPVPHIASDPTIVEFHRASGSSVCSRCGRTYEHHPPEHRVLSHDGFAFLHRFCDGSLVKL